MTKMCAAVVTLSRGHRLQVQPGYPIRKGNHPKRIHCWPAERVRWYAFLSRHVSATAVAPTFDQLWYDAANAARRRKIRHPQFS